MALSIANWPSRGLLVCAALACTALAAPARAGSLAPPRPLSEAEEAGALLAAEFLTSGPDAVWAGLSTGSPLRRLGRDEALKEIEVRLGAPQGARWELRTPPAGYPADRVLFSIEHPSGLDQAVELRFSREGALRRLRSIRSFVEPPLRTADVVASGTARDDGARRRERLRIVLSSGAAALAAGGFVAALLARRRRALAATLIAAGVVAAAGSRLALLGGGAALPDAGGGSPENLVRLSAALEGRQRIEAGQPVALGTGSGAVEVALRTWSAQIAQQGGDAPRATRLLAAVPDSREVPWADVLRGRLAFMERRSKESVAAYQRLIDEGLYHDGLLSESLEAFSILGYPTGRDWSLEKLVRQGSRSPRTRYLLARELRQARNLADPLDAFRSAWRIRPLDRNSLFSSEWLWDELAKPEDVAALRIGEPEEPPARVAPAADAEPHQAVRGDARLCGTVLRARFDNGAELVVPEGTAIAPANAQIESPEAEIREERERALAGLPELEARLRSPGALSRPSLRVELEAAAFALAERHRWAEIARLTGGYSGSLEQSPPLVLLLRAEALRRTERTEPAKTLLAELERNPAVERTGDPGLLLGLASLMRATGDLSGAIRCAERASRVRPDPALRRHLEVLRSEKALESGFSTQVVGRFDLRFRSGADLSGPIAVGKILNSEWSRLAPWFTTLDGRPVVVDLLPWADFARTYGSDLLGLYDGKIRVPVFGVPRFTPPVVAILTHELAHAMIAKASDDRAPSWFHEGLAQRVEMGWRRENRVGELVRSGTYLSLRSIEEVLRSRPAPELVEAAYVEAEWLLAYLERRHGKRSISRLMEAFRDGASTDEALERVTGLSVPDLDRKFREWALSEAPKSIEERVAVRYDLETM